MVYLKLELWSYLLFSIKYQYIYSLHMFIEVNLRKISGKIGQS
jgi:hypothetical protein